MDFPEGTYIGVALLVESTGIGPGTISRDNAQDKITYTVTNRTCGYTRSFDKGSQTRWTPIFEIQIMQYKLGYCISWGTEN
jgi:hypothetical protein